MVKSIYKCEWCNEELTKEEDKWCIALSRTNDVCYCYIAKEIVRLKKEGGFENV